MEKRSLIIGLDLSFSLTGITISHFDAKYAKSEKIIFHRVHFDDASNKTGKRYTPTKINNVNDTVYRMPSNINIKDIILDKTNINNREQLLTTLKGMICSKTIFKILEAEMKKYEGQIDEVVVAIENFIMPAYSGKQQMKHVSGLIMLQGYVRAELIKYFVVNNISFKMLTEVPSSLKLFFTGNGSAEKLEMLERFLDTYDGNKLIPGLSINDLDRIDDVVDSFALMMYGFSKIQIQNNLK